LLKHATHVAHHAASHYVAHHFSVPADAVHHLSEVAVHYLRVALVALLVIL
jgi:hypothetical protein